MAKGTQKYSPDKSTTSHTCLANFLRAPIVEDLTSIPGIATSNLSHLKTADVVTSYQLFGKFLELRTKGLSQEEHCDQFFKWLHDDAKITSHREAIVEAVASRLSIMMPALYDQSVYTEPVAAAIGKKKSAAKAPPASEEAPSEMIEG